jgi:hypothetical protein
MLEVSILRLHGQVQEMFLQDGLLMKCLVMEMLTLRQDTERNVLCIHEASAAAVIVIIKIGNRGNTSISQTF